MWTLMKDIRFSAPTDVATRIYLARHGRTRLNAAGVLRGHLDPGLDAVGLFQALTRGDDLVARSYN